MSDNEHFESDVDVDPEYDDNENVEGEEGAEEEEEKNEDSEYEETKNNDNDVDDEEEEEDDDEELYEENVGQFNVDDCLYKNAKPKKKSYIIEEKSLIASKTRLHGMIIIKTENRITGNRLTDYEMVRIMGTRMRQFQLGAPALIESPQKIEIEDLARLELIEKKTPYHIGRPLPNNYIEVWSIAEMIVPDTLWG